MSKERKCVLVVVGVIVAGACILGAVSIINRKIPFVKTEGIWSIALYQGDSPFSMNPAESVTNPILTAEDVTDVPCLFVADPFFLREDSGWYLFFEVLNTDTRHGDIGLATSSDGLNWRYVQIVLDEPHHLAYPHVLKSDGDYYMLPSSGSGPVVLYRAKNFPTEWQRVDVIVDRVVADATVFRYEGHWWLIGAVKSERNNDTTVLYHAENIVGPWTEHPKSPVVTGNPNIARPAGRVLVVDRKLFRLAQDCYPTYGSKVNVLQITKLTTEDYEEVISDYNPVLAAGKFRWNSKAMHHMDAMQASDGSWWAVVDGCRRTFKWDF